MTKKCSRCQIEKSKELFGLNKNTKDGLSYYCLECKKKYDQSLKQKELKKLYYQKNKEKINLRRKEYVKQYENTPERKNYMKKYYKKYNIELHGITFEKYNQMLQEQNNCCAICKRPFKENKRVCIDHNHMCCNSKKSCGKCIRGLLCYNCNTSLGGLREDTTVMKNMIKYCKKNNK